MNGRRTRNLFDPSSEAPFKLSRSKLEDFTKCPRCFYLDRRLGVGRPSMPGFALNIAVDELLKNEFDKYRELGKPHPLMVEHGIDAVPFRHEELETWRQNFKGIQFHHAGTNLVISGAVDDVWIDGTQALMVVDYKATSTREEITLDSEYRQAYKRQLEIYQWLLRMNGFKVSPKSYIVYANALKDRDAFDSRLDFDLQLIEHVGDNSWVEPTVVKVHACLTGEEAPRPSPDCEYCAYREAAQDSLSDIP